MFNRLRQRRQQNYVFMLKNEVGVWMDNPRDVEVFLQNYFTNLFIPVSDATLDNNQHSVEIDLVLMELHLPRPLWQIKY